MAKKGEKEGSELLPDVYAMEDIEKSLRSIREDGLSFEKSYVLIALSDTLARGYQPRNRIEKSREKSRILRNQVNDLYDTVLHTIGIHETMQLLLTEAIALAPNDSEELAAAYDSRSRLLFHTEKYEESMNDCRRGLQFAACPDLLKAKMQHRALQCLLRLRDERLLQSCQAAKSLYERLELPAELKSRFLDKAQDCLLAFSAAAPKQPADQPPPRKSDEFPEFERSERLPCASDALKIDYQPEWGRMVVAAKDIQPGDIIVVEPSYMTYSYPAMNYSCCSYCLKMAWCLEPCPNCTHSVYCSEKCRTEARTLYHNYECEVLQYFGNLEIKKTVLLTSLRLMLISAHRAGGIQKLEKIFLKLQKQEADPLKKGLEKGIYDSKKPISVYSLQNIARCMSEEDLVQTAHVALDMAFFLAMRTDFYGKNFQDLPLSDVINDDLVHTTAAIILRGCYIIPTNSFNHESYSAEASFTKVGTSLYPFCSLFNHSCNPNAEYFTSVNNELVVFAKFSIKKEGQIVIAYHGFNFQKKTKEDRMKHLHTVFRLNCKCNACTNDWTDAHITSYEERYKDRPKFVKQLELLERRVYVQLAKSYPNGILYYKKNIMELIQKVLNALEENIGFYSSNYFDLIRILTEMYIRSFGNISNGMKEKCDKNGTGRQL